MRFSNIIIFVISLLFTTVSLCLKKYPDIEFCEGPLRVDLWNTDFNVGVNPIIFSKPQPFYLVIVPTERPENCVTRWMEGKRFSDIFGVPWTVAAQLTHNVNTRSQLFGELNYIRAEGKELEQKIESPDEERFGFSEISSFQQFTFYFGHRYFFRPLWRKCLYPYFAQKIGIAHYSEVKAFCINFGELWMKDFSAIRQTVFCPRNVLSGGVTLGADYCINDWISFMLKLSIIITGPLGNSENCTFFARNDEEGFHPSRNVRMSSGTLVGFPLIVGLSFSWL